MADIFEEVEEEVRKDKANELWSRYGWIAWVAALAIVGYVAFSEWRSGQAAQQRAEQSARLEAALSALEAGEYQKAQADLQAMVDEGTSLSPLAAHLLAQARLVGGGDTQGAVAALQAAADGDGEAFQQLALLKAVYLRAETMTLEEMESELAPLVATNSQIGALAEEAIASKAFAVGDFERARRDYNRLMVSVNAPAGLQQRAIIALDAIPRAAPEPAPQPQDETPQQSQSPGENE